MVSRGTETLVAWVKVQCCHCICLNINVGSNRIILINLVSVDKWEQSPQDSIESYIQNCQGVLFFTEHYSAE